MPNATSYFADRLNHVGDRLETLAGEAMQYGRGDQAKTIQVTPQGQRRQEDSYGNIVFTEATEADFTMNVADLAFLSEAWPQRGDVLKWGERLFQVVSVNEQTFTYVTSTRRRVRVHAKEMV